MTYRITIGDTSDPLRSPGLPIPGEPQESRESQRERPAMIAWIPKPVILSGIALGIHASAKWGRQGDARGPTVAIRELPDQGILDPSIGVVPRRGRKSELALRSHLRPPW